MKNLTTASAITSNGQPAPAGLSTATNSDQLQATPARRLAPALQQADATDNIFVDNRAGSCDPVTGEVTGSAWPVPAAGPISTSGTSAPVDDAASTR